MQKKSRRKERQLRAILAAAEAEREYLRSLYSGSLIAISNSANHARDGVIGREYDAIAAEVRCVGMEDEIRRLRSENEALRLHISAMNAAALTPHGFQIRPGPTGYGKSNEMALIPHEAVAGRPNGDDHSVALQLTGEEEAAPFSCSTSPIPKDPGLARGDQVRHTLTSPHRARAVCL